VLSRQQFEEIHGTYRVGRARQFVIVPLGIDLAALRDDEPARASLRAELGIEPHEIVVGIVGRVAAIKDHDLFLRIASLCRSLARFVVYGDGEDRGRLEAQTSEVRFAGIRSANEIYASLDVVAHTSRNEGTPLVIIEAMALGKPVISTAVGGVVDLLGPVEEHVKEDGAEYEIRSRGLTVASGDATDSPPRCVACCATTGCAVASPSAEDSMSLRRTQRSGSSRRSRASTVRFS
jgi:glycosyltransferase involved in cell wall biosynthesis